MVDVKTAHTSSLDAPELRAIRQLLDHAFADFNDDAARLYRALGWRAWEGPTWVLGPNGLEQTPEDDGGIYVLSLGVSLDFAGDIACDWRDGDVW